MVMLNENVRIHIKLICIIDSTYLQKQFIAKLIKMKYDNNIYLVVVYHQMVLYLSGSSMYKIVLVILQ